MTNANGIPTIFSSDVSSKEPKPIERIPLKHFSKKITTDISEEAKRKGELFAKEITDRFISDFENKETDQMVHVSTFIYHQGMIYMSYYANTQGSAEDPNFQTARLAYCPIDNPEKKTILDIQSVGDTCYDGEVVMVYDTILMQQDDTTLFVLWTANISGNYYRLYRTFNMKTKELGPVQVNRFKVGDITNDFSASGIRSALAENNIGCKTMYSDIGIMQKLSTRVENGETYYYTGAYSGDLNCIIKSRDFITWEYVSQPDFPNESKWENAVYVIGDKCFYFVRQHDETDSGFLTVYNLVDAAWETPVLIQDCQSRSDFIIYNNQLYLFHAPTDREHIGIVRINTEDISKSKVVLQAKMDTSCFYPFIQYNDHEELCMSYTINRKHIRLAEFTLSKYI